MARYTDDSRDRVRDAVDMVDLVGTRVELRRAGVNRFEGLCPFHDERTPSFGINPAEKLYYCFGCGEGGDAFKFVQETEGVGFAGALEYLADRYGVALELVEEDPAAAQRRAERERLLELLERTAAFYVRYLWDSEEAAHAREYLAGRGLDEGALREFRVGYAPSAWDKVLVASRRTGFTDRELVAAGLASRSQKEGRTYDRFRRRIMFPLCDQRGRVLGFGARAMGADQKPKYLNSSDGLVFHKGRHLFGADIARTPATKAGEVIVAEGYTDVIAMHQAGLRHTVGLMGTALTDEQVGELARLAPTVLLALDADAAGQEAMLRGARVAARRNLTLRVVPLPVGSDPADLVAAEGARGDGRARRGVGPVRALPRRARAGRRGPVARRGQGRGHRGAAPGLPRPPGQRDARGAHRARGRPHGARAGAGGVVAGAGLATGGAGRGRRAATAARSARRRPRSRRWTRRGAPSARSWRSAWRRRSAGRAALAEMDLDAEFSSDLTRRAAAHVLAQLAAGGAALPEGDDELATLIAALTVLSGGMRNSEAAVEGERLSLEVQRVKREIEVAKAAAAGDVGRLVALRQELERRRDGAIARAIEETHATD